MKLTIPNTAAIQRGAVIIPIEMDDTARFDICWQNAVDLQHGTRVFEFKQHGEIIACEESLTLDSANGQTPINSRIQDIILLHPDQLTDQDCQTFGYHSRAECLQDWPEAADHPVWAIKLNSTRS